MSTIYSNNKISNLCYFSPLLSAFNFSCPNASTAVYFFVFLYKWLPVTEMELAYRAINLLWKHVLWGTLIAYYIHHVELISDMDYYSINSQVWKLNTMWNGLQPSKGRWHRHSPDRKVSQSKTCLCQVMFNFYCRKMLYARAGLHRI